MKKSLFLLLSCIIAGIGYAQTQDALVFFADKEDVATSIANPITILTQAAIDRKQLQGTPIDERDVPLNETYKAAVNNSPGISVMAKSKWLNAVYVRGTKANIDNLLNLSFVTDIEFMDKSLNRPIIKSIYKDKFEFETPQRVTYNYGIARNQVEMIKADYLHENNYNGAGISVAFMDNGYPNVMTNPAFEHIRSEGRILGYYDFVKRTNTYQGNGSHGAHTFSDAGAILENANPEYAFVGTAPKASYYLFITEDDQEESPAEEAYWVEALERSDSLGVYVVNTSLGYHIFDKSEYNHSYNDLDGQTTIGARGANAGFDKGMIMVTSAGNEGYSGGYITSPADAPGAFTIGAVNESGIYAYFSSHGPVAGGMIKPDVMAQGSNAAIVNENGNVSRTSGTSFSSPIMAGAVASLWQAAPHIKNDVVMQIIRESASLYNNPTDYMGYGIPNMETALNALLLLGVEEKLHEVEFALYPNPVTTEINIHFPKSIRNAEFSLFNVLGNKILQQTITSTSNKIDVSNLASGLYIASIVSNGKKINYKILKE